MKEKLRLVAILLVLVFPLSSCNKLPFTSEAGTLTKKDTKTIVYIFDNQNPEGFYASLDFKLKSGKVLWQIYRKTDHSLRYEGYAVVREGKLIRAITYPKKAAPDSFNQEEEQSSRETFGYLQFDPSDAVGEYVLTLKPVSAEGEYQIKWFHQLPKK